MIVYLVFLFLCICMWVWEIRHGFGLIGAGVMALWSVIMGLLALILPMRREFVGTQPTLQVTWEEKKYEGDTVKDLREVAEFTGHINVYRYYSMLGIPLDTVSSFQ